MVTTTPPLPQPDSLGAQPFTLLLTADPSLLSSCVLKPLRLTSGLFLPPDSFQKPLYRTLFVKDILGGFCVCVFVCMFVCNLPEPSIVLFLCKVTLGCFWCVCVCVCVHAIFQNLLYSTLFVQG